MAKKKKIPNLKDVRTINERSDDFLLAKRNATMTRVLQAIDELEKSMLDSLTKLKLDPNGRIEGLKVNLKQTQSLHASMLREFEKTYNIPMKELTAGFTDITNFVDSSYQYLGEAAGYTQADRTALAILQGQSYDQFAAFGANAADRLSQAMYSSVIGNQRFSDLVATFRGILKGGVDARGRSMAAYAKTYAFDSVMNFNNSVNTMKSELAGMKHYMYVGDVIATTRDFCKRRVMKVYSKNEIDSWKYDWKGKSGPAFTNRGGWNCRHHWRGVKPEWFGSEKDGKLPKDVYTAGVKGK